MARPRAKATPSWTVLYVGIAVAALTYPGGRSDGASLSTWGLALF